MKLWKLALAFVVLVITTRFGLTKESINGRWKIIRIEATRNYGNSPSKTWEIRDAKRIAEIQGYLKSVESRWEQSRFPTGYGVDIFVEGFDQKGKRCYWLGIPKKNHTFISKQVPDTVFFYDNNQFLRLTEQDYYKLINLLNITRDELQAGQGK